MPDDRLPLTIAEAEAMLRSWLGEPVRCSYVRPLHGGMIHPVLELEFDRPPHRAVVKLSSEGENPFEHEERALRYLRANSRLPVPEVCLRAVPGEVVGPGFLLIERLAGVNLGEARLTLGDRRQIDGELAELLLELHSHERETFGSLDDSERCLRWLDCFEPRVRSNFEDARPRLTPRSLALIPPLLEALPEAFASEGRPTLIHGDIWATNIIVERQADGWHVSGLVDPGAHYADVEDELAYLEVFGTVTGAFFARYTRERPLREGYPLRRLYYWLNTLLLHVWIFGDEPYVARTERIAEQLAGSL